ncbi:MAG: hypothetical protein CVV00_07160 [Firmicutes bacterium HGW-Firmicutes-5]|nr:MAG: hypothetical protein CVV00_07160 [Firmicutes bacterium HGW-Firmicutes-5]
MIEAILKYNYMQNALMAAVLTSLICGVMGTIIVQKRLVSMSGGIAHASFGGIGLGYFLAIEPIIGGLVFATITSVSVGAIQRKTKNNADTIASMFWSAGMALGIFFVALTPGYPPDMTSYLFGDILAVSQTYIRLMVLLTLIILFIIFPLFNYWKLYLFDEEYAKIMGVKVILLEITIPPTIAKLFTYQLKWMMGLSVLFGIIFSLAGLSLSYYANIPSGATIILVAIGGYFLAAITKKLWHKRKHSEVDATV